MAGDVGWKSVELQIEALIPGLLLVAEVRALSWPRIHALNGSLPSGEFLRSALVVAIAYAVGMISSYLSRATIDWVSERGPRAVVFGAYAHAVLDKVLEECKNHDERFVADLDQEQKRKSKLPLSASARIAEWNAVYRSALRRGSTDDVGRRRSQGRFVRNLFFPILLGCFVAIPAFFEAWAAPWAVAIGALLAILFTILLYAYTEYVVFAEAYDLRGVQPKETTSRTVP